MLEGSVTAISAEDQQDQLLAQSGDRVIAEAGQPLRLERLPLKPTDAVQWAVLIPPLFENKDIVDADNASVTQKTLQQAYDTMQSGKNHTGRSATTNLIGKSATVGCNVAPVSTG